MLSSTRSRASPWLTSSQRRFTRRASQRQDTLLGAFCSTPALSVTVSFSTLSPLLVNTCFTWETRQTDSFVSLTNCSWEPARQPLPCKQLSQLVESVESIALHRLREDYQGHHAPANGIDAKTLSSVPCGQRSLHHVHQLSPEGHSTGIPQTAGRGESISLAGFTTADASSQQP